MKFMYSKKRVLSVFLSVLTVITMLTPACWLRPMWTRQTPPIRM